MAIAEAEKRTSAEIRVYVSHRSRVDALAFAKRRFHKLKMDCTPMRNAVMIFMAPRTHKFAVVGDVAVHAKCGDDFWRGRRRGDGTVAETRRFYRSPDGWSDKGRGCSRRAFSPVVG